jgi:chlorophyll synthase
MTSEVLDARRRFPEPSAVLELLKPITWFAPMWALGCGVVSAGLPIREHWGAILASVLLAGPLVCGTSQAVNDWFDRHVDAINEPHRPIPSGRVPGRWGLAIAIGWTAVALLVAAGIGPWVLAAAVLGLALAWMYSAPPFRLKRNGWYGNAAVGLCYESLPWFTGAAALTTVQPDWRIPLLALLYGIGAHGIMVLNDFKAVDGDREMGVRSLPVQLGTDRAAKLACAVMALPQLLVVVLLLSWGRPIHAALVAGSLLLQGALMVRLVQRPKERAAWYNATGTTLYVLGMLASAFAVRSVLGGNG